MANTGNSKTDLLHGNVMKTLIVFSWPFVLATLMQTLYSLVDMIIVGQVVGKEGISALSVGGQILEMITVICVGFSSAGQIFISQLVGAKKEDEIHIVNSTLTVLMLILAGIAMAVGLSQCDNILRLLSTPDESFAHAHAYLIICFAGVVFIAMYNMISAIFRGMGDSIHPFIFVLIATILNAVLDAIFVIGFGWGAGGAALATVIGQAVSVVFSLRLLMKRKSEYHFSLKPSEFIFSKDFAKRILRLAIPMAIQSAAIQISFLFVNGMFNAIGVTVSAVFGATTKLRSIPHIIAQGTSLGAAAMFAQNFGAGETERVKKIFWSSLLVNVVVTSGFAIAYLASPGAWFGMFTTDATVLAYASMSIFCLVIEFPAKVFMPGGSGLINGCGNVKLSFTLAIIDAFLGRILLTWIFGSVLGLGVFGYLLGYSLATYVTAIPQLIYFLSGRWKKRAKLV